MYHVGHGIRHFRATKKMTLEDVAARAKTDTGNLSRIEAGTQTPRSALLGRIAEALEVGVPALYNAAQLFAEGQLVMSESTPEGGPWTDERGKYHLKPSGSVDNITVGRKIYQAEEPLRGWVPLISWVQAGYGVTAVDNLHPGEGERIETTYKARRSTYALRVNGDSMEPKFPQGCIVIVEPEDQPEHGKFVIIRQNGDEPTLKQYVVDGSVKYLKPLNARYPIMVMREDDAFCGVVNRVEMDV